MTNIDTATTILPAIGAPFGGGFFAGLHPTIPGFALIVAPKAEGEAKSLEWGGYGRETAARDLHDGAANTAAIHDDDHPAAAFCRGLTIGGFDDWYLPSRTELNRLVEVFMPRQGGVPEQTIAEAFKDGGPEAFYLSWYWTSTQYNADFAWLQSFDYGRQYYGLKDDSDRVIAVRKILL